MKKIKSYAFVPKSTYKHFFNRCYNLLIPLVNELKELGITAKLYPIGSGKRHLVTQLTINDVPQPFDLDFNLEIDINILPKKYRNLKKLKDTVRSTLNSIINKENSNDFFSDGQDSTSVISVPLHFEDSKDIQFTFDLAIVSRNSHGNLQRLIHNKKDEIFTWSPAKNSKDFETKAEKLKSAEYWNEVRTRYLEFKNQFVNDITHPSFVCYIMAVNEVHSKFF